MNLQNKWIQLASKYCDDLDLIHSYWKEIELQYTSDKRHYHTLNHISNMLQQSETNQEWLENFDGVNFSIWYHDVVYNPIKNNNESKSAELAQQRLQSFKLDESRLRTIEKLINSTKTHEVLISSNQDNSYFLDFDLAILGTDWNTYTQYTKNIRKEYSVYPDFLYNSGRKKVLLNFLDRRNLFFTEMYRSEFEAQAKENLQKEISLL